MKCTFNSLPPFTTLPIRKNIFSLMAVQGINFSVAFKITHSNNILINDYSELPNKIIIYVSHLKDFVHPLIPLHSISLIKTRDIQQNNNNNNLLPHRFTF